MGRASRKKRERQVPAVNTSAQSNSVIINATREQDLQSISVPVVYRFFSEPEHADALAAGHVWLSTLETCRAYEDPLQGDPHEATHEYNSGHVVGSSGDVAFEQIAARSGILIGPGCSNITISNNTLVKRLPDAFVLCTTEHFSPEKLSDTFGRYCVEISNPQALFHQLTNELSKRFRLREAAYGRVIYRHRKYVGHQEEPGPIGFVKPPDKYQDQREVRFLWTVDNSLNLKPFLLEVPQAATLCRRIA